MRNEQPVMVARKSTTIEAIRLCNKVGDIHLLPILRHVLDTGTPHWETIHRLQSEQEKTSKKKRDSLNKTLDELASISQEHGMGY